MMFESDAEKVSQWASTGTLPEPEDVAAIVGESHRRYAHVAEGEVADYIPVLARARADGFAVSLGGVNGLVHEVGDVGQSFSIQSVSKAFIFALVSEAWGHHAVRRRIGVNNTGLPFDSVMALELNDGSPMNPMVNAGAIATTSMLPGADVDERWDALRHGLSRFAGRDLSLDEEVYASECLTNDRNRALAHLLRSYGELETDPDEAVDLYTRQCSLSVTAHDLAVMGATLAGGGINPLTGNEVVSPEVCRDTLAVLTSCGMYERSGEWNFEIGLPAKSGVSGGIVAMAPGKGAIGVWSPPLDRAGNSVRGQRVCAHLSRALGLNPFASRRRERDGREAAPV